MSYGTNTTGTTGKNIKKNKVVGRIQEQNQNNIMPKTTR